jgi:HAD superfamily phosphoserine phosphatase-like hydrolase
MPRFRSVIFDADSTLAGIEGVDWLARARGGDVAHDVAALTRRAMDGEIPLEDVYALRLERIAPTRAELDALGDAYVEAAAPGARAALAALHTAGIALYIVSGGIRQALLPLARHLGVDEDRVHAVPLRLDIEGGYLGMEPSPLARSGGKATVVAGLELARPALAVGDGVTDLEMLPRVDAFVAFTGFVRRAPVVAGADHETRDLPSLADWILG